MITIWNHQKVYHNIAEISQAITEPHTFEERITGTTPNNDKKKIYK